jgi:hypothetical protein
VVPSAKDSKALIFSPGFLAMCLHQTTSFCTYPFLHLPNPAVTPFTKAHVASYCSCGIQGILVLLLGLPRPHITPPSPTLPSPVAQKCCLKPPARNSPCTPFFLKILEKERIFVEHYSRDATEADSRVQV